MPSHRDNIFIFGFEKEVAKIHSLIKKCATERGKKTEKFVEEVLEVLRQEGKIASFYMTTKWSREDKCGVDVVVYLNDGAEIRRQIKSSFAGMKKHLKKYGGEKNSVIYGSYFPGETLEEYKERIFRNLTEKGF